jgi:thiamine pyrophosphokinase
LDIQTHFGENPNPPIVEKGERKMFFAGMALGAMAGTAFGIGLMCCVIAGKREDQRMEQIRIRRQKQGEPKQIPFRDIEGIERFSLLDGESLCMMAEDGTKEIGICRFVDEKQVDVNGQVWEIGEFLWQMERRGIQVYPLETAEKKKR